MTPDERRAIGKKWLTEMTAYRLKRGESAVIAPLKWAAWDMFAGGTQDKGFDLLLRFPNMQPAKFDQLVQNVARRRLENS